VEKTIIHLFTTKGKQIEQALEIIERNFGLPLRKKMLRNTALIIYSGSVDIAPLVELGRKGIDIFTLKISNEGKIADASLIMDKVYRVDENAVKTLVRIYPLLASEVYM